MTEAGGIIGVMPIVKKPFCFRIEPIEASLRADPEDTRAVFNNPPDDIMAQTVRIIRIVEVTRELLALTIEFVEPSHRARPDRPVPVFINGLRDKYAVTELFKEVSVKVADRPGGYLRIIKLGNRQGDNASMAMVELVDYNEIYNPNGNKKKKSTRRGRSKKVETAAVAEDTSTTSESETATEE